MRIARFTHGDDDISYGLVDGKGEKIAVLTGDPLFTSIQLTGETLLVDDVRLLAPVIPRSKVVGIGRNYVDHAKELGNEVPDEPMMFLKPNTSVCGPGDPVVIPAWSKDCHYEGELAVVIGRMCKNVKAEDAKAVIFGYTCANDVTARDVQRAAQAAGTPWAVAKGFDTSCPLGPWIETELDLTDTPLQTRLDGEPVQNGSTADLMFGVATLVEAVSRVYTLLPGDVILTGTPAGVGTVTAGRRVEVEVGGIGTLSNPFVAEED